MKCICGSEMSLCFSKRNDSTGTFLWKCTTYPTCSSTKNYTPPENRSDFANNDFTSILRAFPSISPEEKKQIELEIQTQMPEILIHFIECTWGAHYNTMFGKLIKRYLDDPQVLDFVLRSDAVKDIGMNGKTGAKIYPELLRRLGTIPNRAIHTYLRTEFSKYFENS